MKKFKFKEMEKNKLMLITFIVIFIFCVVFYFLSNNDAKKEANEDNQTAEILQPEEAPESDFDLSSIEVRYSKNDGEINMFEAFEKDDQVEYFKFSLYDYLYKRGYKKIKSFDVAGGVKDGDEKIRFSITVTTEEDDVMQMVCWYDDTLLSYYFIFEEEKLAAQPVTLTGMDSELTSILFDKKEELQKDFGEYLFTEKMIATKAEVSNYELVDDILEIQVVLDDEYMTYCKIYYDVKNKTYEFKKWG